MYKVLLKDLKQKEKEAIVNAFDAGKNTIKHGGASVTGSSYFKTNLNK